MAVTIVSFRWLEILEKEFDKNFVDLDLLIGDLDAEEPDFVHSARQKLAGLSSCFAQLTHKAQTIFQNSAKVEAELVDLRTELVSSKTRQEILEEESRNLVLQLHSLQLDRLPSNQNPEQYKEKIETALKLSPSKNSYSDEITFRNNSEVKKLKNEILQYQSENIILRNSILALHSEVYGARLAAKYLDKELAGRIQQLQLLGKEMRTDVRDRLWRQLESEILLHRHKTVIRACRNRTNHEFIPADSRIFNFGHSGDRYLGNDMIFRRKDSSFKSEFSRRKDETIKKSESNCKTQAVDSLTRKNNVINNNLNSSNVSNNNINNNCNDDDEDDDTTVSTSTLTSIAATCAPAVVFPDGAVNKEKIKSEHATVNNNNNNNNNADEAANGKSDCLTLNGSIDQNCSGKVMVKDANANDIQEKDHDDGEEETERNEGKKTDGNNRVVETKEIKSVQKKSVSSDGEDFSCVITGEKRTVIVKRQTGQGLGISITGGREHGVPILISELEVGGPAYESKNLFVGDAILKVNDVSLENSSHFEAVKILTNLETNDVKLLVQFIAVDTDEETSLSEDLYGYRYRFFDTEVMDSSDALALHPLHSKSAHAPAAPLTPELNRNEEDSEAKNHYEDSGTVSEAPKPSNENEIFTGEKNVMREVEGAEKSPNLIDKDTDCPRKENTKKTEKLEIDLFGFRFQTSINDIVNYPEEDLLDDFLPKKSDSVKPDADLIQIEVGDSKPVARGKKFEYVDENIFSGLEDHSILDNIMKSFSEDDFSYPETEKEKTLTSDSGLEICLSGSDNDGEVRNGDDSNRLKDWANNLPEKVELKTLQHIFDRSFSSNLSSPRGSTSFDDDILSTEHSDEKSNSVNSNSKNKVREIKHGQCNIKKGHKCFAKNVGVTEETFKKSHPKSDLLPCCLKNDAANGKKIKRSTSDVVKRNKTVRKSKENLRKDVKLEKRKNLKELESEEEPKMDETQRKRETNFKMTDRFEENLIEYNVKSFDDKIQASPNRRAENFENVKKVENFDDVSDELEETIKLSRRYGLKIPGRGVKADYNSIVVVADAKSPEKCVKVLENHFKHFKPGVEGKQGEKEMRSKMFRCSRYESFGDPDFGTPV